MSSESHAAVFPWTVELVEWQHLSHPKRVAYLSIVGELGGEWWGNGEAAFETPSQVHSCVAAVQRELALRLAIALNTRGSQ